jgi:hypothetical protein
MDRSFLRRVSAAVLLLAGCDANPQGPHVSPVSSPEAPPAGQATAGPSAKVKRAVNPREITSPD